MAGGIHPRWETEKSFSELLHSLQPLPFMHPPRKLQSFSFGPNTIPRTTKWTIWIALKETLARESPDPTHSLFYFLDMK